MLDIRGKSVLLPFMFLTINICIFLMRCDGATSDAQNPMQDEEGYILKPYTEDDLARDIRTGMTRSELIAVFGRPLRSNTVGGKETLEYWISARNLKRPVRFALNSFSVTLSKDVVVGWDPSGYITLDDEEDSESTGSGSETAESSSPEAFGPLFLTLEIDQTLFNTASGVERACHHDSGTTNAMEGLQSEQQVQRLLEGAASVLRRRIQALNVSPEDFSVRVNGASNIVIEAARLGDVRRSEITRLVCAPGHFEIRLTHARNDELLKILFSGNGPLPVGVLRVSDGGRQYYVTNGTNGSIASICDAVKMAGVPADADVMLLSTMRAGRDEYVPYYVDKEAQFVGRFITSVGCETSRIGQVYVRFKFEDQAKKKLAALSMRYSGMTAAKGDDRSVCLVLDGILLVTAYMSEPILNGDVRVSSVPPDKVRMLKAVLTSGPLELPLKLKGNSRKKGRT